MGKVILVTGGRDYGRPGVAQALSQLLAEYGIDLIIHGGASGADQHAADWARVRGIHTARIDALWDDRGRKAGSARNAIMARLAPAIDLVVAFPGGVGTADMVSRAQDAGLRVWAPYEE